MIQERSERSELLCFGLMLGCGALGVVALGLPAVIGFVAGVICTLGAAAAVSYGVDDDWDAHE